MDLVAPPSPLAVVAVCVVLSYAALAVIWRRSHWIVAYPRTVLAGLGAISLAAAFALVDFSTFDVRVRLDASEEPLMVRGDPAREVYRLATQAFGNDDVFVIAMVSDDVFSRGEPRGAAPDQPQRAAPARRAARREPGRHPRPIASTQPSDWIDVARFIGDEIPRDPAVLADAARARPRRPDLPQAGRRRATAPPRRSTSRSDEISDREFVDRGLDGKIRAIAEAEAAPNRAFHFAGRPHVKSRTAEIMARDLLRLIPLAVLVAAVVVLLHDWLAARRAAAAARRA